MMIRTKDGREVFGVFFALPLEPSRMDGGHPSGSAQRSSEPSLQFQMASNYCNPTANYLSG
jgi:hypothetical protein